VVRRFWILEGTLFAWPFPRVKCSELIFLSLLVWSVVSEGPIRRPERGGSEWELIKIFPQRENSAYAPNSQLRIPTRVHQSHVVITNLPTLGANPKRAQSESETQRGKDLAAQHWIGQTVREA
jgi:hypothetical protein